MLLLCICVAGALNARSVAAFMLVFSSYWVLMVTMKAWRRSTHALSWKGGVALEIVHLMCRRACGHMIVHLYTCRYAIVCLYVCGYATVHLHTCRYTCGYATKAMWWQPAANCAVQVPRFLCHA